MLTQQQRTAGLSPDLARRAAAIAQALEQGRLDEAERSSIACLVLAPKHAEILRLFGTIQFMRGRTGEAIDTLLQACAARPDDALIHNALGGAYEAVRDYPRALACLRRACELAPELAACWSNLGKLLFASNDVEAAIPAFQRAVELAPRHVYARTMLANILSADGRDKEAETQFRKVVEQDPACGHAWSGLATLKPMPLNMADIKRMRAAFNATAGSQADRISTGFALAMALDHKGDYAQAFAVLGQTHALARRLEPWNAGQFVERVDSILSAFSAPLAAEPPQGEEVIFITSLPRSGSTLTEQVLASHSMVEGSAELPHIVELISEESDRRRQPFPLWVGKLGPADWHGLGRKYLALTERWRKQRPRFTDKMPGNWLYIGSIMAMLPQARVVVVRRDPLETCLGCYRYLVSQHPYTHDIHDLAGYWRQFDRAARRWRALYPQRVHELVYEELQADPETRIRELLAFCGLPFEQQCLDFHSTERRVVTPSAAQVREPMRRDTARAAKYGALLDPLRSALGMSPFRAE
ncbi:MAG: sulfotransferase [Rudaea sp.]|nr:sulfotransferase [Rudaea sp.]